MLELRTVRWLAVQLAAACIFVSGQACMAQDNRARQNFDDKVKFELKLATPFFISGMKLALEGRIKNGSNEVIRIVPPDKWPGTRAWDDLVVNLHTLVPPWHHVSGSNPNDFSVQIAAGREYVFSFVLDEHYAKDEKTAQAGLTIHFRQGDILKKTRGETEFAITSYDDTRMVERERLTEPGPETKWTSDPLKVKIGKIRVGEKYFLVARCLWKKERGWVAFATSIVDEVHKDTDFILGALPDLKVRLCYERGDALIQVDLSAWTGQPVREDEKPKKSEK